MDRFVMDDDIKAKIKAWLLYGNAEQILQIIIACKRNNTSEKLINWEAIFEEIEGM